MEWHVIAPLPRNHEARVALGLTYVCPDCGLRLANIGAAQLRRMVLKGVIRQDADRNLSHRHPFYLIPRSLRPHNIGYFEDFTPPSTQWID